MNLRRGVKVHAVYDDDIFVGLTIYFESAKTVYLAYLAIDPSLRGKGYGSKVLQMLEQMYPDKQIVLDIEPLDPQADNYHQRVSRLKFYQRNGWHRTHQMLKDEDGQFEALVDNKRFDKKDFAKALKEMSFGFYQFKIEK